MSYEFLGDAERRRFEKMSVAEINDFYIRKFRRAQRLRFAKVVVVLGLLALAAAAYAVWR